MMLLISGCGAAAPTAYQRYTGYLSDQNDNTQPVSEADAHAASIPLCIDNQESVASGLSLLVDETGEAEGVEHAALIGKAYCDDTVEAFFYLSQEWLPSGTSQA